MALACCLDTLRLPAAQRGAFDERRLRIISPFSETENRTNAETAHNRNRFIATLADEVVFAFIAPDGGLSQLSIEVADWQIKQRVLFATD